MTEDAQGHRLSGATEAAVTAYDQAVRAFNLVHGDAIGLFDAAREAAPDFAMAYLGKAWVFAVANDPGLLTRAKTLVETARPLRLNEREQAHLAALTHLVQGARAAAVGGARPPPDALPARPSGPSGCHPDRRVPRTLPLGPGSLGARPAMLVQGSAGLRDLTGLPRLRAGGSRRLPEGRRRIARRRRTGAVEFLAASHRGACDGNDRAPGRRSRMDGGARGAVVDPRPHEPGPHLVAQGALPPRARPV